MDLTQIIVAALGLIGTVVATLITYQLVPWLKSKKLYDAAVIAVNAAEALYGRYHGEEKLVAALNMLKEKGYKIDDAEVRNAVQAAWKQLDMAMYNDGEKYIDE